MKTLGVCLIVLSMVIGFISDKCINPISVEPFIGLAFCFFLIGIYALTLDNNCQKKGSLPNYDNPQMPPQNITLTIENSNKAKKAMERMMGESKKTLGIKQKFINGFYEYDISKFENTYGGA